MQLYKRISLLLSMGIMGIGLITFTIDKPAATAAGDSTIITKDKGHADESGTEADMLTDATPTTALSPKPSSSLTPEPTPTDEPTPTPEPNVLKHAAYPEIDTLINDYLNAKLECTLDAFRDIVTDVSYIDLESIQKRTEVIKEYANVNCYTKRGVGNIEYVVYYTYEIIIPTIETPALCIDSLYVTRDENDKLRVFLGNLDDDVLEQLRAFNNDPDVQELIAGTYEAMDSAIKLDEDLRAFWERIYE